MSWTPRPGMRVSVTASSQWSARGRDGALVDDDEDAPAGGELTLRAAAEPVRPDRISAGTWRKMSRLTRLAAMAVEPLVSEPDDAVIVGVSGGEFSSSVAFLRSYYVGGAALASPLAFQNSVHNAPAAHLSIELGFRGWSETILAGEDTFWRALERAMTRVIVSQAPVLLIVVEDLSPEVRDGLSAANARGRWCEGAAALRLEPARGTELCWRDDPQRRGGAYSVYGGPAREAAALVSLVHADRGTLAPPPPSRINAWLQVGPC